ncbi:FAD-dependent oxidoreductase [Leifsonia sp. H3M29-4]|uniref:FAD-dependent oxidoreductase n=1 Tax=Salinibacterium metalliresistens TaxID=3031321 RepID=UPI0023D9B5A4|nr:FAD-dependent oxidoreductase [Salinibacterium metalliresistens]MDF1477978.1 FAD-dependent oxidoreductase [Salinibacterium metalliresistens]
MNDLRRRRYDVLIYGASLAGIMAAVRLRRRGRTVCILEPTEHVGGIVAGGLVKTDIPNVLPALGGLTLSEFFEGIGREYGLDHAQYRFEPKVAERVSRELLDAAGVDVLLRCRIDGPADVEVRGGRVRGVRVADAGPGWIGADFFIDASYEGDLMAASGVPYRTGRESREEYGEEHAGFLPTRAHRAAGLAEPGAYLMRARPDLLPGAADAAVQAYNFRGVLTTADDRLPFARPEGYDPSEYRLFQRLVEQRELGGLDAIVTQTAALPRQKFQTNQGPVVGFDLPGVNWDYPDGSWARRDEIIAEQVRWHQGLLHWMANDPSLSETFRARTRAFGYPADEFVDSPHGAGFPHALYIREARRMVGEHVLTEHDLFGASATKSTAVAYWKYGMDCHITQYWAEGDTLVAEGTLTGSTSNPPVDLYQLPAESLMPRRADAENLAVAVCFSASHVGYLSARMEPAFGMLGEACGELAHQSLATGRAVQDYDYPALAVALEEFGSVLRLRDDEVYAAGDYPDTLDFPDSIDVGR